MAHNYKQIEERWQKEWAKDRVFEPKTDRNHKKFFFTVPFPYVNGPMHVGHGRTFTVGDFIVRYKRKLGFNVLYPIAYHLSGMPVLAVSKMIEQGDKKTIGLYKEYVALYEKDKKKVDKIVKSFSDPWAVANYFSSVISKDFGAIGLSMDWSRTFNTGEKIFNKFVEWQYHKLKDAGVLVRGSHPVTFDTDEKNAVGEDDIKDGDTDKVRINEFTAIKFKLSDRDAHLVAATLRPETIYGITNIWINPTAKYIEAKNGSDVIIISETAFEKLHYQQEGYKKIAEHKGKDFIDKEVLTPVRRKVPVLPAEFVDPENATGVVYSVPAHAPYDYQALVDLQKKSTKYSKIKPIVIIDIPDYKGKIPAEEACKKYKVKNQNDTETLDKATQEVYKQEFYSGILNRLCDDFADLKISEIKAQVKDWLKKNAWAFTFYDTSRPAITRAGGKVVVAVLNDQWFIDYSSKDWKNKTKALVEKMQIIPEKYRKQFLDTIDWLDKRPCARRRGLGTEFPFEKGWVIESLSDSTIYMIFYLIANHIKENKIKPEELTQEFFDYVCLGKGKAKNKVWQAIRDDVDYWYPNDQRHTAPAHLSNHLTFYLMHHTKIFPEKYWPKAISFNEMLIREGAKMSKSRGNVLPLVEIPVKYGADLYRLYVLSSADIQSQADWREVDVTSAKSRLERFASELESIHKFEKNKNLMSIDKWIISKFYTRLKAAKEHAENYRLREYCVEIFFEFLKDLDHYKKRVPENQFYSTLRRIAESWVTALEPVIPHICEEIWHNLGNNSFISMEKWPYFNEENIDKKAEQEEESIKNAISDVQNILRIVGKPAKKVYLYTLPRELGQFRSAEEFFSTELRAETRVFAVNDPHKHDPENKAQKAKPGKPGIYVEA